MAFKIKSLGSTPLLLGEQKAKEPKKFKISKEAFMADKSYLGDGVYACGDRYQILLTVETTPGRPEQTIYLEDTVFENLLLFKEKLVWDLEQVDEARTRRGMNDGRKNTGPTTQEEQTQPARAASEGQDE